MSKISKEIDMIDKLILEGENIIKEIDKLKNKNKKYEKD